jgi:hypothetical protein
MNKVKKSILKANNTMQEATTRPTFFLLREDCFELFFQEELMNGQPVHSRWNYVMPAT